MAATEARSITIPADIAALWRRGMFARVPAVVWLPALLIGLVMALPLAYLVVRGISATDQAWDFLFRLRTAETLLRTITLVVTVTITSVAIALPIAWLTVRTDMPYRRAWAVLTALPLVIPSYVGAFLLISALGPRGLLQQAMEGPFGVDRLPNLYGLGGATVTLALLSYPYVLLIVRGVLVNMDPALQESARSLGLGPWRTTIRVTLPQLRPAIAAGSLLVGFYALSDFGAVSLLRYETFTWAIYQQYTTAFDRSIAAVLSLLLVVLAAAVLVLRGYSRGRMRYHRSGAGVSRPHRVVRLGRWRWVAAAFCGGIVLVALALPVSVLTYWVVRGLAAGEAIQPLFVAARNSVAVSALAAIVAALSSVPVAALVVRYPGILSQIVERLSFSGYVLPGIVVALSLVFFGVNVARPIYQTIWLLIVAYLVLFFPLALEATRAALLQVGPRLEEAARGLGRSQLQTTWTVTAPLMRGGILAGAALVFLVTMKELPATLILGPLGFKTLATEVWSTSSEAFFARAAAPALLLVVLSSIPMAFLTLKDRRLQP